MDFDAKVLAGIRYLDKYCEFDNWREGIDLKTLDLSENEFCVLGQIYNGYTIGKEKLNLSECTSENLGFSTSRVIKYNDLTNCWIKHLKEQSNEQPKAASFVENLIRQAKDEKDRLTEEIDSLEERARELRKQRNEIKEFLDKHS